MRAIRCLVAIRSSFAWCAVGTGHFLIYLKRGYMKYRAYRVIVLFVGSGYTEWMANGNGREILALDETVLDSLVDCNFCIMEGANRVVSACIQFQWALRGSRVISLITMVFGLNRYACQYFMWSMMKPTETVPVYLYTRKYTIIIDGFRWELRQFIGTYNQLPQTQWIVLQRPNKLEHPSIVIP